jgi:hypothetical protein
MKNTFLTLVTCSIFSFGIAQTEKNVGDFTKVTAFDKIDVNLVASTENKVILTGANSQDVELINKKGELKIRMPFSKTMQGDDVSVIVYYKNLEAVEANEGSRISSQDKISVINFDIICKEGSEIKLTDLQADRLQVRVTQGSKVTINGTVKNQDILSNSGGEYEGNKCITEQTVVTVNAGGKAEVYATDLVEAKTRAGGEIKIYGKPKQINEKKIAGGTIEQAK